jgi:PAS domain S-box-containing protein
MDRYDFQTIVERLPVVVYVDELDGKSSPLYVSPQIQRLLGYTQAEWLADPELFIKSIHPDDRDGVLTEIAIRNERGSSTPESDYRMIARDGRVVWVRDDEIVVDGAAHGYLQDVTAHKQDRMRLELLAHVLALAAQEMPPEQIIAEAADTLAAAIGDVTVTFVEIAPDGTLDPRYTTNPSGLPDVLPVISEAFEPLEHGPLVVEDVLLEKWLEPAWEILAERGIRSAVDVPLRRDGKLVAVIWFNTPAPRRWDPEEVRTLTEVAAQLAVVLERSEARERRVVAERNLLSRDAILEAVSRSAQLFLTQPSLEEAMVDLMRVLGEATGASGAYVFENLPGETDLPLTILRASWSTGRWRSTVDDPRFAHVAPAPHFPRWAEVLGRGDVVNSHVRDLPDDERETLALADSLSIIAVPVFVEGRWWGFITFEDCEAERDWSVAETDALRVAAGLIAAAVNRDLSERHLRRRDAVLEAVSHAAEQLVSAPHWRDAMPSLLRQLGEATDASRAYLFETGTRADGLRIASQRFEWASGGITAELGNKAMQDMCFREVGLSSLEESHERNEIFAGNVKDLGVAERELLEAQAVRALITVPIFVDGDWWGFIGFDDCVSEREWSPAETEALRTAASLIEAAIERERSETVLREHEQTLHAVFETALDAIFINDDERRYVDVNPAGCEFLGVSRDDLIGKRIEDFLPPHKAATMNEDWTKKMEAGPARSEWEVIRPDGSVRIADASAHPNFVPGLHIAFLRDVTDRKRLESELLNSQKLDSLGRLAGGVAHDFNNLLTGITGYASLLLERTNGDADLARDLGEIRRAADRAAELTKQLLAFGRRQMLQPRPLDLNAAVSEIGSLLQRLLGDQIELVLQPAAELGIVRADPGQIEQVIVNLAVNARDAMPNGGRVTLATRNAGSSHVELVVADEGVGMDEETLAQVFEPFFTTRNQGVGLGLASVHGIVHQSGGEVRAESAPGAGSVFTVRLPRVRDEAEAPVAAPPAETAPGSETILLVEDEDVVRDLTCRVLERQGYTVLACADGAEAVAVAESDSRTIDLLLTDVVMPGLRGHEVARQVSATRPEIKVLYMSGYAEEALVGGLPFAAGALIEKPFAIDTLAVRVREALER